MPTMYEIGFPIPKTYQDFENIVCSFFTHMYGTPFQKVGVSGQKQSGIDLLGNSIGVQCKNYYTSKLPISTLEEDISKAEQINPPLKRLFIVTTAKRDANIQYYIRQREKNLPLELYYWDVIEGFLLENPKVAELHYPKQLFQGNCTQEFCNEFLKLCNKYSIYQAIFDTDYICPFSEKLFDNIGVFCDETEQLLYSDKALGVDKKKLQEVAEFIDSFRNILHFLALRSFYNGSNFVAPQIPNEERECAEKFIGDNRRILAQIYNEFKFGN